jgi:putative acetyltransferase
MIDDVQIRLADPGDFDALGEVVHDAIRLGADQYDEAQRAAWSPAARTGDAWSARLGAQSVWMAASGPVALGVMTLAAEGYIDLAYIRREARGQGLFRRLYGEIETESRTAALPRLWTHASLHARAPFEAMGFGVLAPETVRLGGEAFKRFVMEKRLVV